VQLESPPFAACHAGVGYYVALINALQNDYPPEAFTFTVCCGDDPAMAHDALRRGLRSVRCRTSPEMTEKLVLIAAQLGARILHG
jgi:hypothetical protein